MSEYPRQHSAPRQLAWRRLPTPGGKPQHITQENQISKILTRIFWQWKVYSWPYDWPYWVCKVATRSLERAKWEKRSKWC
jgi:hypothetical protein